MLCKDHDSGKWKNLPFNLPVFGLSFDEIVIDDYEVKEHDKNTIHLTDWFNKLVPEGKLILKKSNLTSDYSKFEFKGRKLSEMTADELRDALIEIIGPMCKFPLKVEQTTGTPLEADMLPGVSTLSSKDKQ